MVDVNLIEDVGVLVLDLKDASFVFFQDEDLAFISGDEDCFLFIPNMIRNPPSFGKLSYLI